MKTLAVRTLGFYCCSWESSLLEKETVNPFPLLLGVGSKFTWESDRLTQATVSEYEVMYMEYM